MTQTIHFLWRTCFAMLFLTHITISRKVPKDKVSVEKNLIGQLLEKYRIHGTVGRPVNDSNVLLTVTYGLQLIQILDLDENKQILRTNCWSVFGWEDNLLMWDPKDYKGINQIRISPNHIWTPDIKLYNFADERLKEHREARVVVYNTGTISWIPQALFKSTCPVEITYFPFDTQICKLEFGSWTYDSTKLVIDWNSPSPYNRRLAYIDFSDYMDSNEWTTDGENYKKDVPPEERLKQIKSVRRYRVRNHTTSTGKTVSKKYPVLIYWVRLRRNSDFYVSILVIPCTLLSSLTLVVFWLPPESPAKMMLGMNIFVAFFVLLLLLAESTPSAVKSFPLIGAYFCLNMIMITLSTFLATFVINLYFRGDRNGPLPKIIRKLIIEGLGSILRIRQYIPLPNEKKLMNHVVTRSAAGRIRRKVHVPELKNNKFIIAESELTPEDELEDGGGILNQLSSGPTVLHGNNNRSFQYQYSVPSPHPNQQLNSSAADVSGDMSLHGSNYGLSGGDYVCIEDERQGSQSRNHSKSGRPTGQVDSEDSPILMKSGSNLERDVRDIKRYIRLFVNRQKENDRKNLVAMEWRTMALVLDRLFFFMYITTIGLAVITSLPSSTEPIRDDKDSKDLLWY